MQLHYPFALDNAGRTAGQEYADHVRALIAQVLFTDPGERVNRPTFGSGVRQFTFSPSSSETLVAVQFLVQAALEEWLGEIIDVAEIVVDAEDTALIITISYTLRRTGEQQTTRFFS